MNKSPFLLLIIVSFLVDSAIAEEQLVDSYFLEDTPIVLSATRLKQSLSDAPAAITVIDKAMIKASGAKEIVELFRLVPGMQVMAKKEHLRTASYHGMSDEFARGLQVLVDGHSIYNASFGGLFWGYYPLLIEDIERIEVIRGPAASTYGPNAFLGVINIITSHTSQDQGVQTNLRIGGRDAYRGAIRHGGQWKDLGYRFSFVHNENDGLEDFYDGVDVNTFSSRFDYQMTNKDTLQYNLGVSQGSHLQGVSGNLNDPKRVSRSINITQNLRWEHQFDAIEQISMHVTHNRHEIDDDFISNGSDITADYLSEQIDLEFQHIFSPLQDVRMVWGLGSRVDIVEMPLWLAEDDKTNVLYRVFANIEWKFLDDFSFNLGALVEKNSYTHVDASPKVALNYRWSEQQTFRIMASKSSRMPTVGEQNLNVRRSIGSLIPFRVQTNKTLKPVEVVTVEIGHHGQFFDKTLMTDVKVAHQRFHRLTRMDFNPKIGGLEYSSGDVATGINVEGQVDYKPNSKALIHMGYSWINMSHKGGINDYKESVPHNTLNFLAAYEFPWQIQASLGYYYRSDMQYIRAAERIDQYQRLDFILRKAITLTESQKLELSFIHQNNLGSKDEFDAGDRLADQYFFEVSYQFD